MFKIRFVVTTGLLAAWISTAGAATITYVGNLEGNANGGGAFIWKINAPPGDLVRIVPRDAAHPTEFVSMCIEEGEIFYPDSRPYTAVINGDKLNSWAIRGGDYNGVLGSGYGIGEPTLDYNLKLGDPISTDTATLFHQYAVDPTQIAGWNALDPNGSTDSVQLALWYFEHDLNNDLAHGQANALPNALGVFKFGDLNAQTQAMIAWAQDPKNNPGNIQDVRVLNVFFRDGTLAQDQLVRVTHDSFVPLPASAWMGLPLLAGIAFAHIKRRRSA